MGYILVALLFSVLFAQGTFFSCTQDTIVTIQFTPCDLGAGTKIYVLIFVSLEAILFKLTSKMLY